MNANKGQKIACLSVSATGEVIVLSGAGSACIIACGACARTVPLVAAVPLHKQIGPYHDARGSLVSIWRCVGCSCNSTFVGQGFWVREGGVDHGAKLCESKQMRVQSAPEANNTKNAYKTHANAQRLGPLRILTHDKCSLFLQDHNYWSYALDSLYYFLAIFC